MAGHFADAVRAAWLEWCRLFLRHFVDIAKHLTRTGEVEAALWSQFAQRGEDVMRAVDVRVHRRETVCEALRDEALGGEVIALVKVVLAQDVENTRVTLETGRVQGDSIS